MASSKSAPYEALAAGYDLVMAHVDYEAWAEYIHRLLFTFGKDPESLIELGCGSGLLVVELQPLGDYQYLGLDLAENMIRIARERMEWEQVSAQFEVGDFTNFKLDASVDAMILLQDGLNYVLELDGLRDLFRCVWQGLKADGVFIFDQSTPYNSINNAAYFDDEDEEGGFHYIRKSHYDPDLRLHTTRFTITFEGETYHETHIQKAYTRQEIAALIEETGFILKAAYDDMSLQTAHDISERIHWVLVKPA